MVFHKFQKTRYPKKGFTLLEVLMVVTILGILATLALHRVYSSSNIINRNSCHTIRGNIEVQAQLYYRNNSSWPTVTTLSANNQYFPEAVPTCPVDGSAYTLDTSTHQVVGHNH